MNRLFSLTVISLLSLLGIPSAYGSYEELASDPNVDIIYVATIHTRHRDNTVNSFSNTFRSFIAMLLNEHASSLFIIQILCLNHGKHVLVEKPMAINAKQAQEMIETARCDFVGTIYPTQAFLFMALPYSMPLISFFCSFFISHSHSWHFFP